MTINLITKEQHQEILKVQESNPVLTFWNEGYQYIHPDKIGEKEQEGIRTVEAILKESIIGFTEFNNFRLTKKEGGEIGIRFQYNYGAEDDTMPFTGVGYIKIKELRYGFE